MPMLNSPPLTASTTAVGTVAATSTGNVTLISSGAGSIYVYSYNLAAESTANVTVRMMSGSTTAECWRTTLECDGSTGAFAAGGIDRDVMFVSPPAYLFRTAAGDPLTYEKGASSAANALAHYSFGFWRG
jgi:hypothetical protein